MKTCPRCQTCKPHDEYRRVARLKSGLDTYCKSCRSKMAKEYSLRNREKELARYAKYKTENAEMVREKSRLRMREKRALDPEKSLAYTREYRKNNPDRVTVWDQKKRAHRIAAPGPGVTKAQWSEIKAKYKHCCVYCLKPFSRLTMDHVLALKHGGEHAPHNVVPACSPCNSSKQARDVYVWAQDKLQRLI